MLALHATTYDETRWKRRRTENVIHGKIIRKIACSHELSKVCIYSLATDEFKCRLFDNKPSVYSKGEVTTSETTLNGQYYQNVPEEKILFKCCCRHIYSYFCWCPKPAKVTNSEIITEKRPNKTSLKTTLLVRSNPFLFFFKMRDIMLWIRQRHFTTKIFFLIRTVSC
jgi:hypothetical protein